MKIAFIGLGNMGRPMAVNLAKSPFQVVGHDVAEAAAEKFQACGGTCASSLAEAVDGAEVVITVLRNADDVRSIYGGEGGILDRARPGALLIDCSTIGPVAAREVSAQAARAGFDLLDAPVAGGQAWAEEARLTFIVGGVRAAFERAEQILMHMGRRVLHAGPAGNGQVAKVCNNLIACISTTAVAEAFVLGKKLGMDHQTLFDIVSTSSGNCWGLTTYCPVPGPVPTSPASRGYAPGFATQLMLKDLLLASAAADEVEARVPMTEEAVALYRKVIEAGHGARDWSVVAEYLADSGS
jgi:3-hydroxyisobutyrate dehydrogenase